MGIVRVPVTLRPVAGGGAVYQSAFLADTGAIDCMAPTPELTRIGIGSEGKRAYELADGSAQEYDFGFARIEIQGDVTVGLVIFGPPDTEPILGVTALESAGFTIDPVNGELKRMPAIPLKQVL